MRFNSNNDTDVPLVRDANGRHYGGDTFDPGCPGSIHYYDSKDFDDEREIVGYEMPPALDEIQNIKPYSNVSHLMEGDLFDIPTGDAEKVRLRYLGVDSYGYWFEDTHDPEVVPTYHRYSEEKDVNFLLSFSDNHHQGPRFIDAEKALEHGKNLMLNAYKHNVIFQMEQHDYTDATDISIDSVPVSDIVHTQRYGTCYAHACATAIRSVESRIVGREPIPFDELVETIIENYGINGGCEEKVLKEFCKDRSWTFKNIADSPSTVIGSLRSGRVVVASFVLSEYQWECFSNFFRLNPNGVLTRNHLELDPNQEKYYPPELCELEGHTAVITGFSENKGTVVYKIKNSWGNDFASDGYFHVEADAFPQGFSQLLDVFFYVQDLSSNDIHNYLLHLLQQNDCVSVLSRGWFEEVSACGSIMFKMVKASLSVKSVADYTTEEIRAIHRVQTLLRNGDSNVNVFPRGVVEVQSSSHKFRIVPERHQPFM